MTKPDVTVVIPTYNHENYVAEAIKSVRNQSIFDACKVIVSDDCSSDETVRVAQDEAKGLANVSVRKNQSNLGIIEHYRYLATLADTPYLAILEGDDYWNAADKLELQKKLMDAHPQVGVCFTACLIQDEESGTSWHHPGWERHRHRIIPLLDMLTSNPVATFSNCLYRTDRFSSAVKIPSSTKGYDWLLNMTIAADGGALYAATAGTLYRLHTGGTWTSLTPDQKRKGIIESLQTLKVRVDAAYHSFIDAAVSREHNA